MVEFVNGTLHSCECGYTTLSSKYACKHSKTKKCSGKAMKKEELRFVKEEDYNIAVRQTHSIGDTIARDKIIDNRIDNRIDNSINDNRIDNSTNITLVLPERTTKEDFVDFLRSLGNLGYRESHEIIQMPGKMLMFTRDAKILPGALIERNNKIIEKLPDGSERVMGKKKAIRTYTHEAVEALVNKPPADGVEKFLETERGYKRTKMSLQDAARLRANDPKNYHNSVPWDVKSNQHKMENYMETSLDKVTTANKLNGFM